MTPQSDTPGRLVTVAVLLIASMTIMANATIAPSLPGLRVHFAAVAAIDTLAPLLLSLPSLAIVLTAGGWGWLVDRNNRQTLLIVSGLLYAVGGTSGLWAGSIEVLGAVIIAVGAGLLAYGTWQREAAPV
jgi:MFS family permease